MIGGYPVYDADAHVNVAPQMWEDLPKEFAARRPRPALIHDSGELGSYTAGWLIDGRMEPHGLGPGLQPATPPRWVVEGPDRGSLTLVDAEARIRDLDRLGIDVQFLFPSTLYARWTTDPRFEAALCRSYNRFIARQTKAYAKRLKWAGLVPLREAARVHRGVGGNDQARCFRRGGFRHRAGQDAERSGLRGFLGRVRAL